MNAMQLMEAMTNIDGSLIENVQPKSKRSGKTVARIMLLAAVIAALSMSVLAAKEITNWFEAYFGRFSEEPLTENQIAFIDENTTETVQSQTSNGYTVTLESAISDGRNALIKLKLTAPEDTKLDALNYFPGNDEPLTAITDGKTTVANGGWGTSEDHDGKDNTVDILCHLRDCVKDHTHWKLQITELKGTYNENVGTSDFRQWEETIVTGLWEFEVFFPESGKEERELITEPVPGKVNIGLNKDWYLDVFITSFKLRAMSAEITYEYLEPTHGAGDFDEIFVVMKDGSRMMLIPSQGHPGSCTYDTRSPIILSDAAHVLLPDGTKLPIPQS